MKRIDIVGGGISGLSTALLGAERFQCKVFEKESKAGGLIRCETVADSLFHLCGGHVFNTKNQKVADWFWSKFNREQDWIKATRHSAVCLADGRFVDYPIENHVYQLGGEIEGAFQNEMNDLIRNPRPAPDNFDDFLRTRFGETLYRLYFRPYNMKVWRRNLSEVPLSWLEGKLPMPTYQEMIDANTHHIEETGFVHSTFYYEKRGGSQFIADTLAKDVDISYNTPVETIECVRDGRCRVNGELFDAVVFCGNIKDIPKMLRGADLGGFAAEIDKLESHGTTAVFCETDPIPYSWFYQPSDRHDSHRFICTGNFSPSNNAPGKMTCTVEFTDEIAVDEIKRQLELMPYHPRYLTHHFSRYTYPIQHRKTRQMIADLKRTLNSSNIRLVGRFAEWEYFNMDAAIASAMNNIDQMNLEIR